MINSFDMVTQQQATGYKEWRKHVNECCSMDCPPLDFWEFYNQWCLDEGLFNDTASYQYTQILKMSKNMREIEISKDEDCDDE